MINILLLTLICFLSYFLKRSYFNLPLDRDYGGHGYVAYSWMHKRGLIYRDVFESKTPLLKLVYMLIFKIYGINRIGFRKFFAQYNTVSIVIIYCIGLLIGSPQVGLVAALLFALASCIPSLWWHFSNIEAYYILPSSISFLLLILMHQTPQSSHQFAYALGAGFFCSSALMFKQPAAINTVFPQFLFLLLPPLFNLLQATFYFTGFIIPFVVFFVYFIVIHKTPLSETPFGFKMLQIIRKYHAIPLFKKNPSTVHYHRIRLKGIFTDCMLLMVFGAAGALFAYSHPSPAHALLLLWIGTSIISVILGRTYLPYHFIPLIPPLAILSALSIVDLFTSAPFTVLLTNNFIGLGALAVLSLFFIYQIVSDLLIMPHSLIGNFYSGEDGLYASCEEAGKYIKANTTQDDYVYSWGHEATIYLWSERRCPSSMIFPPVMNPPMFTKDQVAKEYASLMRNKPKFFAITSTFDGFKEFEAFLSYNYVLDKKFEPGVFLFKLREVAPVSSIPVMQQ